MLVPNRIGDSPAYRYGFQGQEKDDEIKGEGNSLNYTFRMHDPRVGRFFAMDPLTSKYPKYSPYSFSGNKVIQFIELEGLEESLPFNYLLTRDVVLSTLSNQDTKPRYSRDGVPILSLGYRGTVAKKDVEASLTGSPLTGSGSVNAVQVDISYNLCVDGQYLYYEGTMLNANGSVELNGEEVTNKDFSGLTFDGYYKIDSGENGSNIVAMGETITKNDKKLIKPENDFYLTLEYAGAYLESNLTELGNGLRDFGNLVISYVDAVFDSHLKKGGAPKEVRDHINPIKR